MNLGPKRELHVLVLGASGMLGNALTRFFQSSSQRVTAVLRSLEDLPQQFLKCGATFTIDPNILDFDMLRVKLERLKPDIVINCIGVIKQSNFSNDVSNVISTNALFPHILANSCDQIGARLVHISTDCVFSGLQGMYSEDSFPDANDLYGRSKFLGEVDYPNTITLRTSIIGHELRSNKSLVDWFLSQHYSVEGYKGAIFSGVPTVEIARIIRDYVIPNESLMGLYHVSVDPISKFDLLCKIAGIYRKEIVIRANEDIIIDRSLDSKKFRLATGFNPKTWDQMLREMYDFR